MRTCLPAVLGALIVSAGTALALAPHAIGALATDAMGTVALNYEKQIVKEQGTNASQRAEVVEQAQAINEELASWASPALGTEQVPTGYWTWGGAGEGGVIATISIPRLSLTLPVRQGTTDEVLSQGLGHLPASSLPVGGSSTHCVVAGHTNYRDLELFTHIDKLAEGDEVVLTSVAGTLHYRVTSKDIVLPNDLDELSIEPDRDLLTLLTCYPPEVNTHRLLVRCERVQGSTGKGGATENDAGTAQDEKGRAPDDADSPSAHLGRLPGWLVVVLCVVVVLASGGIAALLGAYPLICAHSAKLKGLQECEVSS